MRCVVTGGGGGVGNVGEWLGSRSDEDSLVVGQTDRQTLPVGPQAKARRQTGCMHVCYTHTHAHAHLRAPPAAHACQRAVTCGVQRAAETQTPLRPGSAHGAPGGSAGLFVGEDVLGFRQWKMAEKNGGRTQQRASQDMCVGVRYNTQRANVRERGVMCQSHVS